MVRLKTRYLLVQIHFPSLSFPAIHNEPNLLQATKAATGLNTNHSSDAVNPTLLFNAPTPDSISAQHLLHSIRQATTLLFGDLGAGLIAGPAALAVKYFSNATSCFVLRCPRRWLRIVWATLCCMTRLRLPAEGSELPAAAGIGRSGLGGGAAREIECVMRVLRVSGSIRKCEQALVTRARALCGKARGVKLAAEAGVRVASASARRGWRGVPDEEVEGDMHDLEVMSESEEELGLGHVNGESLDGSEGQDEDSDVGEIL